MSNDIIKGSKKLKKDIETKILKWNERSSFKIKGIGNLSMSDMDTLTMYADNAIKYPENPEKGFMPLRGGLREIFIAYGILSE